MTDSINLVFINILSIIIIYFIIYYRCKISAVLEDQLLSAFCLLANLFHMESSE